MNTLQTPPAKSPARDLSPDDRLVLAMARGLSQRKAATFADVPLSTARRRMSDPSFQSRAKKLRAELLDRAVGVLVDAGVTAAKTLRSICLKGKSEFARLQAARALLELAGLTQKSIHDAAVEARLEALEAATKGRR